MLIDLITKDTTDYSARIKIIDSTTGEPEQAVEHNTSGISLWYRRQGAVKTSITLKALSSLTDAHDDGGLEHIDDGVYRLDLPDAAVATGASYVDVGGTVTDMIVIGGRIQLDDESVASFASRIATRTHAIEITSDSAEIDAVTSHLTLDLSLIDSGSAFWSTIKTDGSDLLIAGPSGGEIYYAWQEPLDTTAKTGVLSVYTGPTISTSSDITYTLYVGDATASAPTYSTFGGSGSPVQAFSMSQDPSSAPIADYIGGNDGTAYGSMVSGDVVTGKVGKALQFERTSSQYVSAPVPASLNTAASYSVALWARMDSASSSTFYAAFSINGSNYAALMIDKTGGNKWRALTTTNDSSPGYNSVETSFAPTDGQWYHLCVTINSATSTMTFYVDGTSIGTSSVTLWAATGSVMLGAVTWSGTTPDSPFLGAIDGPKIWAGKVLSANEVATLYANESANNGVWTAGTIGDNPSYSSGGGGGGGGFPLIGSGGLIL